MVGSLCLEQAHSNLDEDEDQVPQNHTQVWLGATQDSQESTRDRQGDGHYLLEGCTGKGDENSDESLPHLG